MMTGTWRDGDWVYIKFNCVRYKNIMTESQSIDAKGV